MVMMLDPLDDEIPGIFPISPDFLVFFTVFSEKIVQNWEKSISDCNMYWQLHFGGRYSTIAAVWTNRTHFITATTHHTASNQQNMCCV